MSLCKKKIFLIIKVCFEFPHELYLLSWMRRKKKRYSKGCRILDYDSKYTFSGQ